MACVLLVAWSPPRADAGGSAPNYFRFGNCILLKYPDPWDLENGIFWDHSDPKDLTLSNCEMTEIKRDDFRDTPNVVDIDLDDNKITHVDIAAFESVPKLNSLSLRGNMLREIPIFGDNNADCNLVKLALSRNQIIGIYNPDTFAACRELEELDLSSNLIDYFHPDVFKSLYSLKRLYLHNNRIASVPIEIKSLGKLSELWLNHNRIKHLPSNFVSVLSSEASTRFFFENNPWHCACLLELLADVKRAGVTYHGEYRNVTHLQYGGARPACLPLGWHECDVYRDSNF